MTPTDEPWWGEIFNDNEIQHLQNVAEQAIIDHDDDDFEEGDCIETYMEISFDAVKNILTDIRNILETSVLQTEMGILFMRSLGEALALEWLSGDAPYDEPTADAAQWFLPES